MALNSITTGIPHLLSKYDLNVYSHQLIICNTICVYLLSYTCTALGVYVVIYYVENNIGEYLRKQALIKAYISA